MLGESRRHRWRAQPPHLSRTRALGGHRFGERQAQTGMGQHEVVIDLEQRQLIPQARFALAQGIHPTPDRRYALANIEVEAFDEGGVDCLATSR